MWFSFSHEMWLSLAPYGKTLSSSPVEKNYFGNKLISKLLPLKNKTFCMYILKIFLQLEKKFQKRFEWNFPFPKFNLQKILIYSKLSNISKTFSRLLKQDLKNLLFACTNFPTHKMVLRACSCTQKYVCKKTSHIGLEGGGGVYSTRGGGGGVYSGGGGEG